MVHPQAQLATAFAHHECGMCSLLGYKIHGGDLDQHTISLKCRKELHVLFQAGQPAAGLGGQGRQPGHHGGDHAQLSMRGGVNLTDLLGLLLLPPRHPPRLAQLQNIPQHEAHPRRQRLPERTHRSGTLGIHTPPQGNAVAAICEICTATTCLAARDGAPNSACSGTRSGDQRYHTLPAPCRTDISWK